MINVQVERKPKETIESLLARFSRKVYKSGLISEMKNSRRFLTKAQKKELKKRNRV